jgi:membrane fusion protein (multidrug efflux system)
LLPGAFAEIELVFSEIDNALSVPAIAVIPEFGGKKVFVYDGGQAMPRPVETGIRTEQEVQITKGLAPYDTVIVSGLQSLRPGLAVEPVWSE